MSKDDNIVNDIKNKEISRRDALSTAGKAAAGVAALAIIGGAAYTVTQDSSILGGTAPVDVSGSLRVLAYAPLYTPESYTTALKADLGIDLEVSLGGAGTIGIDIIAAKARDWDTAIIWGAWGQAVIGAEDGSLVQNIPVGSVPKWNNNNVAPLYQDPKAVIGEKLGQVLLNDTWAPGKVGSEFTGLPIMWGVDSYAINPEFVDKDPGTWGAMFDRQYKGKVAIIDIPTVALPMYAMYLVGSGQMAEPNEIHNLTTSEVDVVADFLAGHAAAGQFKGYWSDFGTSLNLMVSREVWLEDCWNSAVFAARSSGVPAYYLSPKEGVIGWFGTEHILAGCAEADLPRAYAYLNHRLGGKFAKDMALQAYQTATYGSDETKQACGKEFYDWNFMGKSTYKSIDEIVPGQDEWIANALFDPHAYDWSNDSGTSSPNGNVKDRGSIDTIIGNMGNIESWVDEIGYHIESWAKVKEAGA